MVMAMVAGEIRMVFTRSLFLILQPHKLQDPIFRQYITSYPGMEGSRCIVQGLAEVALIRDTSSQLALWTSHEARE